MQFAFKEQLYMKPTMKEGMVKVRKNYCKSKRREANNYFASVKMICLQPNCLLLKVCKDSIPVSFSFFFALLNIPSPPAPHSPFIKFLN